MTGRARKARRWTAAFLLLALPGALLVLQHRAELELRVSAQVAAVALTRVDLSRAALDSESAASATTYVVVGTDRRSGVDRTLPALGHLTGEQADAILLVTIQPNGERRTLVLPRDLRVHVPRHGERKLGTVL